MRLRRLLGGLTLAAAGVFAAILVAEVVLRLLGVGHFIAFRGDPATGLQHVAGAEGWYRDEGEAYVRINSAGFRDVDRSIAKPEGTIRVAVLGDSFTEGFQVAQDQTFTAVAARALRSCDALRGRNIEVLNFGVSSYGTAQELILLRQRVVPYAPDIVVTAFFEGNDITDNSLELSKTPERAYFVDRGGQLALETGYQRFVGNRPSLLLDAYFWLLPRSRVLQLVHNARSTLTDPGVRSENRRRAADLPGGMLEEYTLPRALYREPNDPAWSDSWAITERLLREMRTTAATVGAGFILMLIPRDIRAHPHRIERDRIARELGVADLGYVDDRLRRAGARDGYDILALAPRLAERAELTGQPLYGTGDRAGQGHLNGPGHQIAGEALAERVCADLARR